jgi:hypothetical protein
VTATASTEIDSVALHIKGLLYVSALLEAQGAREAELAEHRAELARQRRRLADLLAELAVPTD